MAVSFRPIADSLVPAKRMYSRSQEAIFGRASGAWSKEQGAAIVVPSKKSAPRFRTESRL